MELDYVLIGAVAIAVLALIVYLIKRNARDEEILEHDMNSTEINADRTDENDENAKI